MPLVSEIKIIKKAKQPVLSIKKTINIENLPRLIDESYEKIQNYLNEIGEYPGDIPYVRYFNMNVENLEDMDVENLEVEIGFPVYKELSGKEDIESGYLPEMKAVYTIYQGIYQEMVPDYYKVINWAEENNLKLNKTFIEYYYNSSDDVSEEDLLFGIIMPLK
ncbi:GyrI-like domain-containing protein [Methanobrevibacter sp. TMH8]|uniref:GyrI-like domain-containing protein n=1 Tax=Methanobrevibacter sp. TMH8 TaxID=2848611 RepID=UPI001CCFD71F|nr:GyrI-like domain-containing protein [Methanobrevibacter sp. TMH8]MBZ9571702.1 GyrI-like domain-containing protein [Methanobrevibacter sp. TMH8]